MDNPKEAFFREFRRLAAKVDKDCEQYRQAVTGRNEDFCVSEALKIISDLKKDVRQLEAPLKAERQKQKEENQKMDEISAVTDSLLNNHLSKRFSELEQYLAQYGYKPFENCSKTAKQKTTTEEEVENISEARPITPPASRPPQDPNRTPRLEDAGISQDTLQYLNSLQKNRHNTNRPDSQKPSWSQVPFEFQHNGIICTPSLARSLNADVSYSADLHSALASPVLMSTAKSMPVIEEDQSAHVESLQLNANATKSPTSPVLLTPGIKQILSNTHRKQDHSSSHAYDSKKRQVNVGLFKSDEKKSGMKTTQAEPLVPDLTSPCDEEPVEPELTYSLEALTEMTGVYRINPAMKPPSFNKALKSELVAVENKENATPPEPEMLTNRISRLKLEKEVEPELDFELKQTKIMNDMPASPKLLGNYEFLKH